jgi:hypothetical protein
MIHTTEVVEHMSRLATEGNITGVPIPTSSMYGCGYKHVPKIEQEYKLPMRRAVVKSGAWQAEQKRLGRQAAEKSKQIFNRYYYYANSLSLAEQLSLDQTHRAAEQSSTSSTQTPPPSTLLRRCSNLRCS